MPVAWNYLSCSHYGCTIVKETTSSVHSVVFPEYASGELMHSPLYPVWGVSDRQAVA